MEEKPKMLEGSDLRRTTLECPFCSARTAIHVAEERRLPELLLWKCFDCQKSHLEVFGGHQASGKIRHRTESPGYSTGGGTEVGNVDRRDPHSKGSPRSLRSGNGWRMSVADLIRAIAEEENL